MRAREGCVAPLPGLTRAAVRGYGFHMHEDPARTLDRLLRGIATDHLETVRDAWRDLLRAGPAATPAVHAKLRSSAWREASRGPLPRYLGVLLMLLDELDPASFRTEVDRLRNATLHPVHRRTVVLLARRAHDRPVGRVGPNVPVHVARALGDPAPILADLARWARVPGADLKAVTRIDVIADHPQLDYLGLYNLFFSGIVLTWPTEPGRGLLRWARRLRAESTFYHEVGHHALDHREGGQVADQEREADDYARSMIRRAHPVSIRLGRIVFLPMRPLLRRSREQKYQRLKPK